MLKEYQDQEAKQNSYAFNLIKSTILLKEINVGVNSNSGVLLNMTDCKRKKKYWN